MGDVATAPVLDSDVLIDHLRDAGPGKELVDALGATSGFRITAVTAFELALGHSYARNIRHFTRVPGLRVVQPDRWS
jgi:predicted nucleic acid-binding protein